MSVTYIYSLVDPRTYNIRYVGKSTSTVKNRFLQHVREAKAGKINHRCNWIRQLIYSDLLPLVHLLDIVPREDGPLAESAWIFYGREYGWDLTNSTDGGEGREGYIPTKEERRKISTALKGRSRPAHVALAVSRANKNRKYTMEQRKAQSVRAKERNHRPPVVPKGELHPNSKLTEEKVREIRSLVALGYSERKIALMYDVSGSSIADIKAGRTWKWLLS